MSTIGNLIEGFARMRERARGRRLLLEMDARILKDIGISRDIAPASARAPSVTALVCWTRLIPWLSARTPRCRVIVPPLPPAATFAAVIRA